MKGSTDQPKIFISYSWTNPQHEQWVLDIAERLSGDGIIVVLDKWDLKEGQDKHVFMEQMVNDPSIKKVLVICDHAYQAKADERKGGVGTETQLISKEVYENTGQEKFIPVLREYDSGGKPCIPSYMATRIYVDLSSDERFEENYQKLVRNLYDKPLLKRPALGTAPAYIVQEGQITLKTSHMVSEVKSALLNGRTSANGLISEFLDAFLSALGDFKITAVSTTAVSKPDFDDEVAQTIERMLPLKEDFVDFVFTVFKYQEPVDIERFHDFFERLIQYLYPTTDVRTFTEIDCDNFKFFVYELMLNFVAVLLQLRKYKQAGYLIHFQYFFRRPTSSELQHMGMEIFNEYVRSLDEFRNKRLGLRRVSVTADLIKAHSTRADIRFEEIIQADLVLHYLTELSGNRFAWFPRTSVYNSRGSGVEVFEKMISLQQFEKMKGLLDVESVDDFRKQLTEYVERNKNQERRYYGMWDYDIRPLEKVLDPAKIGTVK